MTTRIGILLFALSFVLMRSSPAAAVHQEAELDLRSIPISQWLAEEKTTEIPWRVQLSEPSLRMDQRLEITYSAVIRARDLNRSGGIHDLFLVSRISTSDGEWLGEPVVVRKPVEQEIPETADVRFDMRVFVKPGDYLLWLVLYDRETKKHNVASHRLRVREIEGDPLSHMFMSIPLAEFPQTLLLDGTEVAHVQSGLFLPVANDRPLDVRLIVVLSPPEQWAGRGSMVRAHNRNIMGTLAVLSQLRLATGALSIAGLDLSRREVVIDQKSFEKLEWTALNKALERAESPLISAEALEGRKNNGAFFREFLSRHLEADNGPERPLRVFIVVTGSLLFEDGSDLRPLDVDGDCHCRTFHVRFRLNSNDVFDELQQMMRALRPKTFNVTRPDELRRTIAEIIEELEKI